MNMLSRLNMGRRQGVALLLGLLLSGAVLADARVDEASDYLAKGDLKSAVIELKNVLQDNPSDADARHLLGQVYLRQGNGPAAEKELRRARALGKDSAQLNIDLAEAYLKQQQFDQVLETVKPQPDDDKALQARGLTLQGLAMLGKRDQKQGRHYLEQAIALDPNLPQAVLGLVGLDLAEGRKDSASQRIDRLLAASPRNIEALLVRAELYRQNNQPEEALAAYNKGIEAKADEPRLLLGRATTYLSRKQVDKALQDLDRVDRIKPNLVMTSYLRGLAAFEKGEIPAAREYLQRVMGVVSNHRPTQLLYGIVSYLEKDYEIADELLGRFIAQSPQHLPAAKVLAATRLKLKHPQGAIDVLTPVLKPDSQDVQLLALMGSAYMMKGDHAKGAEFMQRAVDLQPDIAALRTQLAIGLLQDGATDAAVNQLESAVGLGQDLIQADVLLVMTHLRKKEFDQALEVSKALESRMADNPIPYNLTGLAYLAKNDVEKATERFNKALELDPRFITAEFNLVRIDMAKRDFAAAEQRYRKILDSHPDHQKALLGMAAIAEQRNDEAAVLEWLKRATDSNPDAIEPAYVLGRYYLQRKQALKALSVASDLASRFPANPRALDLLGNAQLAAGEANSAVRTLEKLAGQKPVPAVYLKLANAQIAIKDIVGGRLSIKKALQIEPRNLRAKLALGSLSLHEKNFVETLDIAQQVQSEHPKAPGGYELEGLLRVAQSDNKQAALAFARAYELGKSAKLALRLAGVYKNLGRNEDAIEVLRNWLSLRPNDMTVRSGLAMLLQQVGRNAEAIKEYETILEQNSSSPVMLNNLAWLYYLQGDQRALEVGKKAFEADEKRAEIADTYGWILLNMGGDPNKALTLLQQAYVTFPTNGSIAYHVGVALHKNGRDSEAKRTLTSALRDDASFPEADEARSLLNKLGG